jgi:ubiquinone/menaquinone biosynthesis C-methylase UbiE
MTVTTQAQPQPQTQVQTQTQPDLTAIKARQQATWSTGDYAVIGTTVVVSAEMLCETVDLRAGQRVLDVATGSGNAAIAAARRWCDVTGIDYVPALLERARERAAAERLPVTFQEGDAENIPFPDAAFDVVLSTYGVMFAPNQERVARELLRVCRPGGKIGLVNWTPEGYIGQMFRVIARHVPPPAGLKSPMLWGSEPRLRELFGDGVASLEVIRREYNFRYRSAEHWVEVFRTFYGPMNKTFAALGADAQVALTHDLVELLHRFNRGGDDALVVPSEYVEVIATRS